MWADCLKSRINFGSTAHAERGTHSTLFRWFVIALSVYVKHLLEALAVQSYRFGAVKRGDRGGWHTDVLVARM